MTYVMDKIRAFGLQGSIILFGFLGIFRFFAVTIHDDGFLTTRSLTNSALQTAWATIMAMGLVFSLSAGEIDLGFGSIVAVSAPSAAVAIQRSSMFAGVLAGPGAGIAVGALNGVIGAYLRLPSFLVTLATVRLFAGIKRSMTDFRSIPVINDAFTGSSARGSSSRSRRWHFGPLS